MLVKALHTIHYLRDGEQMIQEAGGVLELPEGVVAELRKNDAVRDPTENEVLLHKLSTGAFVERPEPAAKSGKAAKGDDALIS